MKTKKIDSDKLIIEA